MRRKYRFWLVLLCILALLPLGLRLVSHAADAVKQEEGTTKDVVYGEAGNQKLELDVYGANAAQKRPAIILLHGGGWSSGSRSDLADLGMLLAKQDYVCFSVSYRLVKNGGNRYPAQIDDVQRAVRWIRAHAKDYGVNPDKIGAIGFSAGGHLVALLGTTDTRDNSIAELSPYSSRVQCVVDFSGPTDLTTAVEDHMGEADLRAEIVKQFLGPLPENAANYREASPALHIDKKTVPFLIVHGGKDTLVPLAQSQQLDGALRKAGIESKLIVYPNEGHGFSDPDLVKQAFTATFEFFAHQLKK